MSMLAVFYLFNKRYNSTKTPDNSMITVSGNITLKMPTSIHNPTILFAASASDMPKAMTSNYCAFNNALYWIRDARMTSNTHIEFSCEMDVLATYKNQILQTKAYIAYSTTGTYEIPDSRLGYKSNYKMTTWSATMQNIMSENNDLKYLLQVIGGDGLAYGYMLEANMLKTFSEEICNPTILEQLIKYFTYDPWTGLVALYTTPIIPNTTILRNITIGTETLSAEGYPIELNKLLEENYEFIINTHTDFRDNAPLTTWILYLPFVGYVQLDTNIMYNVNRLNIDIYIEVITGNILYSIGGAFGKETESFKGIAAYSGNCNSRIPVSSTNQDIGGKINSTLSAISSFATLAVAPELSVPMTMGLATTSVGSMISELGASQSTTQINGAISSAIGIHNGRTIQLIKYTHTTAMNPADIRYLLGNPTCIVDTINNYTGYIQTLNFSLSANATAEEITKINTLMDRGVYIE